MIAILIAAGAMFFTPIIFISQKVTSHLAKKGFPTWLVFMVGNVSYIVLLAITAPVVVGGTVIVREAVAGELGEIAGPMFIGAETFIIVALALLVLGFYSLYMMNSIRSERKKNGYAPKSKYLAGAVACGFAALVFLSVAAMISSDISEPARFFVVGKQPLPVFKPAKGAIDLALRKYLGIEETDQLKAAILMPHMGLLSYSWIVVRKPDGNIGKEGLATLEENGGQLRVQEFQDKSVLANATMALSEIYPRPVALIIERLLAKRLPASE